MSYKPPYKLSVCMIVKNEENDLPICLNSIKNVADEIVIVDTGSTDNTIKIAREFGAKVVETEWKNNFSHARNISLQYATGHWILWMDADNYIPERFTPELNRIKHMRPDHVIALREINQTHGKVGGQALMQLRIFPRHPGIFFENKIHEQITASVSALKMEVVAMDVEIIHRGYEDPVKREQKTRRNIAIMELEIASGNNDIYLIFKYAGHLQDLGKFDKAIEYYNKAIDSALKNPNATGLSNLAHLKIAEILMNSNRIPEAVPYLEEHIKSCGSTLENTCYYGVAMFYTGKIDKAIEYLEKSIKMTPPKHTFEPVDETLVKANAYKYLGKIYAQKQDRINLLRILEEVRKVK